MIRKGSCHLHRRKQKQLPSERCSVASGGLRTQPARSSEARSHWRPRGCRADARAQEPAKHRHHFSLWGRIEHFRKHRVGQPKKLELWEGGPSSSLLLIRVSVLCYSLVIWQVNKVRTRKFYFRSQCIFKGIGPRFQTLASLAQGTHCGLVPEVNSCGEPFLSGSVRREAEASWSQVWKSQQRGGGGRRIQFEVILDRIANSRPGRDV